MKHVNSVLVAGSYACSHVKLYVLGFKISNLQLTNQNAGFVTAMQLHILNTSHITVA